MSVTREFVRGSEPDWVARECDRLLLVSNGKQSGDVHLDRDTIVIDEVYNATERLGGLIVGRLAYFCHEFRVDPSLGMLSVAGRLIQGARSVLRSRRVRCGYFIVDRNNLAMQRFIESQGAIRERDGVIYRLEQEIEEAQG